MCGRFTRRYSWAELQELYRLKHGLLSNFPQRYNICPTTNVDAVIASENGERMLEQMRWGLVPAWWNKPLKEMKLATFNARAETAETKPMFRSAFKRTRCLMPASGYYEWHDTPGGKQPYYFTRRDGQGLTVAALWDEWTDKTTGERLQSCCMLITEPNNLVAEVHDRMPVILESDDFEQWEKGDLKDVAALMKPADESILQKWPVSKRVNSSRADDGDAALIERISV